MKTGRNKVDSFDIESNLKQSAVAYYRHEYNLASLLLKGCLRRLSLLPLNAEQANYLNRAIEKINATVKRCDYTGLADIIHFELIQEFPGFNSLLESGSEK